MLWYLDFVDSKIEPTQYFQQVGGGFVYRPDLASLHDYNRFQFNPAAGEGMVMFPVPICSRYLNVSINITPGPTTFGLRFFIKANV